MFAEMETNTDIKANAEMETDKKLRMNVEMEKSNGNETSLDVAPYKPSKTGIVREVTIDAEAGTSSSSSSSKSSATHNMDLAARRRQFMSQPSTVATRRQQAVCVRRAHKTYGTKSNPNIILDGLNMTVPKGSMYEPILSIFQFHFFLI